MKTAEGRDRMVELVHMATDQWPDFYSMPTGDAIVVPEGETLVTAKVLGAPIDNGNYVAALYELCSTGAQAIGRSGDTILGTLSPESIQPGP